MALRVFQRWESDQKIIRKMNVGKRVLSTRERVQAIFVESMAHRASYGVQRFSRFPKVTIDGCRELKQFVELPVLMILIFMVKPVRVGAARIIYSFAMVQMSLSHNTNNGCLPSCKSQLSTVHYCTIAIPKMYLHWGPQYSSGSCMLVATSHKYGNGTQPYCHGSVRKAGRSWECYEVPSH